MGKKRGQVLQGRRIGAVQAWPPAVWAAIMGCLAWIVDDSVDSATIQVRGLGLAAGICVAERGADRRHSHGLQARLSDRPGQPPPAI